MQNPCMGEKISCSACCGLFNLKMTDDERTVWVQTNTDTFLAADISEAGNIVAYRKEREAETLPRRIRDDIYVCPFVGFVDAKNGSHKEQHRVACEPGASLRTGCLLHPQGSPHPQIGLWQHPQNFSFYGEGICLAYDCLAKERRAHSAEFFRWADGVSAFTYGRLASDHTLHRALGEMDTSKMNLPEFFDALAELYAQYNVVTTSFEDIEKQVPRTQEELCRFLALRINIENAEQINAELLRALSPPL